MAELLRLVTPDAFPAALRCAGNDGRPLTYREVAQRAGCSRSLVGYLATGTQTRCSPVLAARLERALGVDTGRLFVPASSSGQLTAERESA